MTNSLADMTWPDVAAAVADAAKTVILPLGATEQHGPHLPLGTDTFRATAQAHLLAESMPDALVAPTLPIGCSDEHHGFAGLLSLDHDTLSDMIVDCARRMVGWGVCRLIILTAHGGNTRALESASARIAESLPELTVVVLGCQETLSDAVLSVATAEGVPADAVGFHGGEGETSEMLSIRPDLVRMERATPGAGGSLEDLMPELQRSGVKSVSPTGTLGNACWADAARGARYTTAQVRSFRRALAGDVTIRERQSS